MVASSPPNSSPGGLFGLQNAGATYQQVIFEHLQDQIGQEVDGGSDTSGYMTLSPLTSDSENEDAFSSGAQLLGAASRTLRQLHMFPLAHPNLTPYHDGL